MSDSTRSAIADRIAADIGFRFSDEIRVGGHYAPAVRDGRTVYISGQVPRIGTEVAVTGRVGETVSLDDARRAAQICTLRTLAILRGMLASLDAVERVLRVCVFIQCTGDFTQQSEVADAASDLLHEVFGDAGVHARTSVGVFALPKNAAVELDLVVAVRDGA
ncbi:RidA family protein [Variovorax sp. KK3]|uniref:RidA family protein n=1 Tax=Variovorax sp. KK3 TaxID=1855728 RepID=UPI00097C9541|nr:RidA family protein [Variovorax sp. KK3]